MTDTRVSSVSAAALPDVQGADGSVDDGTSRELYRLQYQMRAFEEQALRLFYKNMIRGTSHLSLGMEAIAAGFGLAMNPDDFSFATYRGHAHTLARGVPMEPIFAELLDRGSGLLGGKGGSMHLTSVEHGMLGSYAIVGAHLPIAVGAAWSAAYRRSGQVTVCFFGDGTTNIGAFHEALNLAAVWKLPIVFVCENNQYMEYTPIEDVTAVPRPAADRAAAYGLEPHDIDGNDADEVFRTAQELLAQARDGGGPALVEAQTYRLKGHSSADPAKYRPPEEVEAWAVRDPIKVYRERLVRGGVDPSELDAIEEQIRKEVKAASDDAEAAGPPDPETLLTDVWADGSSTWRN